MRRAMMSTRVYAFLEVMEGKSDQVVRVPSSKAGVRAINMLDGLPNVIMLIQACDRHQLAELTNQALASTETMTEGVQPLPTRDGCNTCPPSCMG